MNEEEFAKFEYNQSEEDFLNELSNNEKINYFEEQNRSPKVGNDNGNTESKDSGVPERKGKESKEQRKEAASAKETPTDPGKSTRENEKVRPLI